MKTSLKLQVCLILLFCFMWQNTFSQLLYQDDKKGEYLPPYDPNVVVISQDVERWMNEQLNKVSEKKTIEMKTDVKGRVKSSFGTVKADKATQEIKVVENKQKRLVVVSDMHLQDSKIEPMSGSLEYNPETKTHNYYLNGRKVSAMEYESLMAKSKEKSEPNKGKRNIFIPGVISSSERSWTAWMTADEIAKLTNTYKELAIRDYKEPRELTPPVSTILSWLQIPTGNSGSGVNVCVIEVGCRATSIPIFKPSNYTSRCSGATSQHHSKVVNVVQHAAPNANVYGYGLNVSNPTPFPPPSDSCHIETRSYEYVPNSSLYSDDDMNLDNHIYSAPNYKWPINFVAAGNNGNDYVSSPGKAVNAITVGAVAPDSNKYVYYSSWKNPMSLYNEKPEVGMYTDIDMGIYGSINGTSAATPLTAGLVANLLSNHTSKFFHGQPAAVKATLIVGEDILIGNAPTWDTDNWRVAQKIPTYNGINSFWYARWWNFGNDFLDNDLVFTETVPVSGTYKIAISWLSSGSYIKANPNGLPQDIDLSVSQNGTTLYSASANNPFEVVIFQNVNPSVPLTIRIYRYANRNNDHVLLGYAIRKVP